MTAIQIADPLPVTVPRPMVLMRLGYRRPEQVPEKTGRLIDEIMEQGAALLRPRAAYGLFDAATPEPGVTLLAATFSVQSRSLYERLAGCRRAVLFAATIGAEADAWIHAVMEKGEMTRGLLADAYASSAAIALGLEVESIAARVLSVDGLSATKRHAPGYGDWPLSDQAPLCRLVGSDRIGVTVTEDFLMVPAKSISGVIGGR